MADLLSGALMMSFFIAGLIFLKFYRQINDRLFLIFAFAFWLMGIERIALVAVDPAREARSWFCLLRLAGFILIIWGIIYKNRKASSRPI